MFIEPRKPVTIDELIKGVIIQSGNDASVALAEAISGTEDSFVALMNEEARRLGMTNTNFMNAGGLPDVQHFSTVRDLALLARRMINDHPEYFPYYSVREFTYNKIKQPNRNRLLWADPSVDGMKTGHTEGAGYCLVATARREVASLGTGADGQRRLLSVLLGATSENVRAAESQKLLNWGYTAFDAVRLAKAGEAVSSPRVWKGKEAQVKLGLPKGVVVTVPAGEGGKLRTEIVRPEPLVAPFARGQVLGSLKVTTANGSTVTEVPLTVLEAVEESGIFGRAWDALRLWIQ